MDVSLTADILAQKIKHLLITANGRPSQKATIEEFYHAFCVVLREEIMINWTSSLETVEEKKVPILYFLSMEYLPGRFLRNNIVNMGAIELTHAVLKKMERNFEDLVMCEPDAGLGNGGLGRLSSCFLDSLATLHYPARAYGLRYQYGIFEQEIWNGEQVEKPDCWLLNTNPWESRRDTLATQVRFGGKPIPATNKHGDEVFLIEHPEEVRALPYDTPIIGYRENADYSVLTLRLWSTKESPRNFQLQRYNAGFLESAVENTSLTDVLYPNDNTELGKRVRLKQEFLLVSASLQDILRRHLRIHGEMKNLCDKVRIQMNDTHPALIVAELIRTLTKNYDFSMDQAIETCQACCSYTNHTILREALEEWNEDRLKGLLPRQLEVVQKINQRLCDQVCRKFPGDEERVTRMSIFGAGQASMANLAIFGSHKVNGVAALHTKLLKENLFKDFYEMTPEKFINVTNGVTQRRWLLDINPLLSSFISKRIGRGWITNFSEIKKLHTFADDSASCEEFLQIKKQNKKALLEFLQKETATRDSSGKMIPHPIRLNENAIFDVQIKRIHEYKRQLLNALHVIVMMQENRQSVPRLVIFGGKAAPGYRRAKQIIQLITAIGRKIEGDPNLRDKICLSFIENYNVSKAEVIIPATDLSEQVSTAGWEASGTGNMKLTMNGALTIGTEDGANIEMRKSVTDSWWPFSFGGSIKENQEPHHPWEIYERDDALKRAIDTLKDGTFATNPQEHEAFSEIYQDLLEKDSFRLLQDFRSYYDAQRRVEELFIKPLEWAKTALHNVAAMGRFSVDTSIRKYATEIWGLTPLPPDPSIVAKVRAEYSQHDRCLIGEKK